jgi:DNA-binding XRE family transcriptional regulator
MTRGQKLEHKRCPECKRILPRVRKPVQPITGAQIKTFRISLGMTQQQLADELGVIRESVNEWEKGKAPYPSNVDRIHELARQHNRTFQ